MLFLQGRSAEAVDEMEEAYAVVDEPPDAELAHLAAQIGRLCGMIGEEARGREPLERAMIYETLYLPEVLSHALDAKARACG